MTTIILYTMNAIFFEHIVYRYFSSFEFYTVKFTVLWYSFGKEVAANRIYLKFQAFSGDNLSNPSVREAAKALLGICKEDTKHV